MNNNNLLKPDFLIEVSWEICNKLTGIHTVIATKAQILREQLNDSYMVIGPDVWKETEENPEFIPDESLLSLWREKAATQGLHFRIGRWNVPGQPIAILIDFTTFFSQKDKIFEELWLNHKLDSISGQWDYIEPALFGYAAGKVIQSYYDYYITADDFIVAQFHDWKTGAGVLYLKEATPQIATVFSANTTVLGSAIAADHLALYRDLETFQVDGMAKKYGLVSQLSMEKTSAAGCDILSTASDLLAIQCRKFLDKDADVITPTAFNSRMILSADEVKTKRETARSKVIEVAEAVSGSKIPEDAFLTICSGEYDFRNKGIDLFIEALKKLNDSGKLQKPVVALFNFNTKHSGPRRELLERMKAKKCSAPGGKVHTHTLLDKEVDPILIKLNEYKLLNNADDKVKIVFVPCQLNGQDGVFDLGFYDLLPAFDVSVHPSYYEPYGTAALDSLACGVPTITTNLSGFGQLLKDKFNSEAFAVIERSDDNGKDVPDQIVAKFFELINADAETLAQITREALDIAMQNTWSIFIDNYMSAYDKALSKVETRKHLFRDKFQKELKMPASAPVRKKHEWKKVLIRSAVPQNLNALNAIAKNLWWSWNDDAKQLFESIDPVLWHKLHQNPMALLEALTFNQMSQLAADKAFIDKLKKVHNRFDAYMKEAENKPSKQIAYFSMEYGLNDVIKIYSGGLGVLAGDYLKEASDTNQNMIGIGLLYRYGYFQQQISLKGDQVANLVPHKFTQVPVKPVRNEKGDWVMISLALPGRNMYAKVWVVDIGRIPLYLLDTDIPENQEIDKVVTHQLYGGDWENRFKQELLLGVGGIRMLHAIGLKPDIYHLNEGHAAFTGLERLRYHVQQEKLSFPQAVELVRCTSLFTTHTPVPAGHDSFNEDMLRTYIPHYAERLNISWDEFMNLGRWTPFNHAEKFSMSVLAARLSQEINGVSKIHGRVSREMFTKMYDGYYAEELHIGHVTNGVHLPTWTAPDWKELYLKTFGEDYLNDQSNDTNWQKIHEVDNSTIWGIRNKLRADLVNYVRKRIHSDLQRRQENPKTITRILGAMNENALIIGFARRFATYKRAHLLFSDEERLAELINKPNMPVQLIFAGKAHPADKGGQDLIKKIIEVANKPEFLGKIIFVENYDMELGAKLVQGVDIWLNTPTRPLEASGTSGEKAVMNGVMNFSVLDGWWAEGYRQDAGWALPEERTYTDQNLQDELDAHLIYNILENEIIPSFYNRNKDNIPDVWVSYIKNTISGIAPHFTMKRMLDDYIKRFYNKLIERSERMKADNYRLIRDVAAWKRRMTREWNNIEVVKLDIPGSTNAPLDLGGVFSAKVELNLGGISASDIGVEVLFGQKENDEVKYIQHSKELDLVSAEGGTAVFSVEFPAEKAGVFDYAFRIFPKNELLPHWQDLHLVTWF